MLPFAPGRLMTSTLWPHRRDGPSAMKRVATSGLAPAAASEMIVTGLSGKLCAPAGSAAPSASRNRPAVQRREKDVQRVHVARPRSAAAELAAMREACQSRAATCSRRALPPSCVARRASCAPDQAHDLRLLRLETRRIAPPRRLSPFGREQAALLGQNHPREAPPVRHHVPGRAVDEIVAVREREGGRALPGEAIEKGMVLLTQAFVVEVVECVAPDALAHGVEREIDAVVVIAFAQPGELAGVLRQPQDLVGISGVRTHFSSPVTESPTNRGNAV